MRRWLCFLTILALSLLSLRVLAGTQDDARIAVHVQSWAKNYCEVDPVNANTPCSSFTTKWPLREPASLYLVIGNANPEAGVAGVALGIDYNPESIRLEDWHSCPGTGSFVRLSGPFGEWPSPLSGIILTWDTSTNCQRNVIGDDGVHTIIGVFYVYAYANSVFHITRSPKSGPDSLAVIDCHAWASSLSQPSVGKIGFGSYDGYNPCLSSVPTQFTTWGRIKTTYGQDK